MGTCNGVSSLCGLGGYAFESRCRLGKLARYDTISKRGWSQGIGKHGIQYIVENLLNEDWDPENGLSVPELVEEEADCVVCDILTLRLTEFYLYAGVL